MDKTIISPLGDRVNAPQGAAVEKALFSAKIAEAVNTGATIAASKTVTFTGKDLPPSGERSFIPPLRRPVTCSFHHPSIGLRLPLSRHLPPPTASESTEIIQ